ncbi:hypothetical protein [Dokdonella sp.]|uniref:hypothetical protein n=1 Tax=Dokdonella sp. TaxID=2291710 RepID=UPI003C626DE8
MTASAAFVERLSQSLESRELERKSGLGKLAWSGQINGRSCIVTLSRQGRTRYTGEVRSREHLGYRLRIELSTAVRVRLFFVRSGFARNPFIRWVYRWRKQQVLADVPTSLDGFDVVTADRDYALRLVHQPRAATTISDLLTRNASASLAGSIHFGPGTIHYASPILQPETLTPDYTFEAINELLSILATAEQLPAPKVPCTLTRFERLSKDQPLLVAALIILAALAALLLGAGLLILLLFLVF